MWRSLLWLHHKSRHGRFPRRKSLLSKKINRGCVSFARRHLDDPHDSWQDSMVRRTPGHQIMTSSWSALLVQQQDKNSEHKAEIPPQTSEWSSQSPDLDPVKMLWQFQLRTVTVAAIQFLTILQTWGGQNSLTSLWKTHYHQWLQMFDHSCCNLV